VRRSRSCVSRALDPRCAESLGVSQQTLRNWLKQVVLDAGDRDDGLTSVQREELKELRKRVRRLEQQRETLKQATAFFASETR